MGPTLDFLLGNTMRRSHTQWLTAGDRTYAWLSCKHLLLWLLAMHLMGSQQCDLTGRGESLSQSLMPVEQGMPAEQGGKLQDLTDT